MNDHQRIILGIARTLYNVHGPRYFSPAAYLSLTTLSYHHINSAVDELVLYGLLDWTGKADGGARISESGLEALAALEWGE